MFRIRRKLIGLSIIVLIAAAALLFGNDLAIALESEAPSRSLGVKSAGRLARGKRLPASGANFRAYSRLGTLLGRNTVHSSVRDAVVDAYRVLEQGQPGVTYVYGETGWPYGGRMRPHVTHQNGMSVDFMVPVRTSQGEPAVLPTLPWQKFGYGIEFDAAGRAGDLVIDFDALAAHLEALRRSARSHGLAIEMVILAPEIQARLVATPRLRTRVRWITWMRGTPELRHDEHYHVDFKPLPR